MSDARAGPALAGLALASAMTGACAALTAVPPVLMALLAAAMIYASHRSVRGSRASAVAGFLAGLLLPASPPSPRGEVVTRSVPSAAHADIFDLLARIDERPSSVLGRRVAVTGSWTPARDGRMAAVSRAIMSCCAADAVNVGFDVEPERAEYIRNDAWVRVDGVLTARMFDGDVRYVLARSRVTVLKPTL